MSIVRLLLFFFGISAYALDLPVGSQIVTGDPRTLEISTTADAGPATIPAGTVFANEDGKVRCVAPSPIRVESRNAKIPVVCLDGALPPKALWHRVDEPIAELAPLWKIVESKPDTPMEAVHLAALCLLRDLSFRQWAALSPGETAVDSALDAVTLLREAAPTRAFTLQQDAELKSIAYRTPGLRGKAMKAFQLNLTPVDPKSLPKIGQLLHSAPGDNCPLCRQKEEGRRTQDNL